MTKEHYCYECKHLNYNVVGATICDKGKECPSAYTMACENIELKQTTYGHR